MERFFAQRQTDWRPSKVRVSKVLPDAILRRMSAADRKAIGKAGLTKDDCEALAQAKNERELQKLIVNWLQLQGVEVNVSRMDKRKTDRKGWPDLTFSVWVKEQVLVGLGFPDWQTRRHTVSCAWEVKFGNGKLSHEQEVMSVKLTAYPNGWRFRIIRSLDEAKNELRRLGFEKR